jgi:hypothetical protein
MRCQEAGCSREVPFGFYCPTCYNRRHQRVIMDPLYKRWLRVHESRLDTCIRVAREYMGPNYGRKQVDGY